MALPAFTEVVEPLRFPILGRTFEGYGPSVGDWQLVLSIEAGAASPEEVSGADLYRLALGSLHDELLAANVPFEAYRNAALACAAWARTGDWHIAETVWTLGTDREAITAALTAVQVPADANAAG